jgi:hypothetical protein
MSQKIDSLERAILELGSEVFRVKHRMDEVDKANHSYRQIFVSLKRLLDEKGIVSAEDFEEIVALDAILNIQQPGHGSDLLGALSDDLKKVVN